MNDRYTLNELFGTLLQSVTEMHIAHFKTKSWSRHIAFDYYYNRMPELVDFFIERIYSEVEPLTEYKCILYLENFERVEDYLTALKKYVLNAIDALLEPDAPSRSNVDDIIELIESTLYKIKNLYESLDTNIKFSKIQREYLKSSLTHNGTNVRSFFETHSKRISDAINTKLSREYRYVAINYDGLFYSSNTKLFALIYPTYRKNHYIIATMPMIQVYSPDVFSLKTVHIESNHDMESVVKSQLGNTYNAIYVNPD